MTEDDAREIIEKIMELSALLGWATVIAQNNRGQVLGLYSGSPSWVDYKAGVKEEDRSKPSH